MKARRPFKDWDSLPIAGRHVLPLEHQLLDALFDKLFRDIAADVCIYGVAIVGPDGQRIHPLEYLK